MTTHTIGDRPYIYINGRFEPEPLLRDRARDLPPEHYGTVQIEYDEQISNMSQRQMAKIVLSPEAYLQWCEDEIDGKHKA